MNPMLLAYALDALKILLDPRVWIIMALSFAVGYVRGCTVENTKRKADLAAAEAASAVAEQHTASVHAQQVKTLQETTDALKRSNAALGRQLGDAHTQLLVDASRGFVPRNAGTADRAGRGVVCYDAERLDRGLTEDVRGLLDGIAPYLGRGAGAISALTACVEAWKEISAANPPVAPQ